MTALLPATAAPACAATAGVPAHRTPAEGAPAEGAPAGGSVVGSLHSWDIASGVDGPGSRLVLFTAGCPLRCLYCHNPDTWGRRRGTPTTVAEVMARVDRYRRMFALTGGGVTVSGGEPLQQPAFTAAVLRGCAERGVHTVLDTAGTGADRLGDGALDALLDDVDLCLLDVKSFDPDTYRTVTGGGDVRPTLDFARRLTARGVPLWIRFVLVPGVTDAEANVAGLADFAAGLGSVQRVDVLPFHTLGAPKYAALGIPFPLAGVAPPTPERTSAVREAFAARGLTTT